MKRLLLALVMVGLMSMGVFAEEPKKETPKPEVKVEQPFCAPCRIKELTDEYYKLEQAIEKARNRQQQILGAIEELKKVKEEKK